MDLSVRQYQEVRIFGRDVNGIVVTCNFGEMPIQQVEVK